MFLHASWNMQLLENNLSKIFLAYIWPKGKNTAIITTTAKAQVKTFTTKTKQVLLHFLYLLIHLGF